MADSSQLSEETKQQILEDFKAWSGGFLPDECDAGELQIYVKASADKDLSEEQVLAFLKLYSRTKSA